MSINLNTLPAVPFDNICHYLNPGDVLSLKGICPSMLKILPKTTIAQKVALAALFLKYRTKLHMDTMNSTWVNSISVYTGLECGEELSQAVFCQREKIIQLCIHSFTKQELEKISNFYSKYDVIERIQKLAQQKSLEVFKILNEIDIKALEDFETRSKAFFDRFEANSQDISIGTGSKQFFPMNFWNTKKSLSCIWRTEPEKETLEFQYKVNKHINKMMFNSLSSDDQQQILNTFCQTEEDNIMAEKLSVFNMEFSLICSKMALERFEKDHSKPLTIEKSIIDIFEEALSEEEQEGDMGLFWKIKDEDGNKGYLLGTIHDLPENFQKSKIFNQIVRYLDKSNIVSGEIDINDSDAESMYIQSIMNLISRKRESLSKEDRLTKAHEARRWLSILGHEGAEELDDMQAYCKIMTFLDQLIRKKCKIVPGLDYALLNIAKEHNIPTCSLEGIERYEGYGKTFFTRTSDLVFSVLEKYRNYTDNELKNNINEIIKNAVFNLKETNTKSWRKFRKGKMPKPLVGDPLAWAGDRNVVMAKKIAELVKNHYRSFHTMGDAHTVGEGNILSCLEELGCTVTRKRLI